MSKADLTPANINSFRNSFLQKAAVDQTVQKAQSELVQKDIADLSGGNKRQKDAAARDSSSTSSARPPSEQGKSERSDSQRTTTADPASTPQAGGTGPNLSLFPQLDLGAPGANLLGGAPTAAPPASSGGTSATPAASGTTSPTSTAPASGSSTAPASGGTTPPPSGGSTPPPSGGQTPPPSGGQTPPPSGGTPPPATPGQSSQTDEMTRFQMYDQDANQARTIYMQMIADRQKAMWKMFEILQQSRIDMWNTLQGIMVNKCKAVETASLNFWKYITM